jgi:DNA replication protein DnaC
MKPALLKEVTENIVAASTKPTSHPPQDQPITVPIFNGMCRPDCSICGGVGFIRKNPKANLHDPDFGEIEPCPQGRRLAFSEALDRGQVDNRLGLTSDEIRNLTWVAIKDGLSDGYKARRAVQSAYQRGHGLVFLYGKSGQAKTLSLKVAVAVALMEGKRAAYANMLTMLDDIRLAFDEKENKQSELVRRMDWWLSLEILAIDELDKINSTDWARERIFQLLDARYQRAVRQEALTIIAGNYNSTDELGTYLRSRIEDNRFAVNGMVVHLDGPDGRKSVPDGWKY